MPGTSRVHATLRACKAKRLKSLVELRAASSVPRCLDAAHVDCLHATPSTQHLGKAQSRLSQWTRVRPEETVEGQ
jgi:hypothetical protein